MHGMAQRAKECRDKSQPRLGRSSSPRRPVHLSSRPPTPRSRRRRRGELTARLCARASSCRRRGRTPVGGRMWRQRSSGEPAKKGERRRTSKACTPVGWMRRSGRRPNRAQYPYVLRGEPRRVSSASAERVKRAWRRTTRPASRRSPSSRADSSMPFRRAPSSRARAGAGR